MLGERSFGVESGAIIVSSRDLRKLNLTPRWRRPMHFQAIPQKTRVDRAKRPGTIQIWDLLWR